MEAGLVERAGIPFRSIPAAGLHGVGLRALPRNLLRLTRGYFAARRILGEFRPDVLFFTGGYLAVPLALAGRRVPSLLYVPDIEPGLALRTLARFTSRIAVTAQDSFRYFKRSERLFLSGYPVRPDLADWKKSAARKHFHLIHNQPVVLVLGGSKGARSINSAILDNLPRLLQQTQVLQVTGELDWLRVNDRTKQITVNRSSRYHAYPYLHEEMGAALAAADLVVSRAGASTLGEFPLFGLPAILVPYPHAWRYQKVNAEYLAGKGAALVVEDADLEEKLLSTITGLLSDPAKLASMVIAMQALSDHQAAGRLAEQLLALAGERR
jgi:UDP-N-acetylglucosamine--N-acetylmuramyl-(pentapeptide) pyrophosphoryl-undecaprenol N-acetylglucosamine transferase